MRARQSLRESEEGMSTFLYYRMSTPNSLLRRVVAVGALLVTCALGYAQKSNETTNHHNRKSTEVVSKDADKKTGAAAQLLASNLNYRDTTLVTSFAKAINESLNLDELTEEDLLYPSVDLYGKESWNSSLNPIHGASAVIPSRYEISLKEFVYPLDGIRRINSGYGYRRRFRRMHYGVDIDLNRGDTVRATFSGRVRLVDIDGRGYGKYVVIRHPNGLETLYGHLSKQLVKENTVVHAGDAIGLGGSTGRSTGPHLHYETRFMGIALNPQQLIDFASGAPRSEMYVYAKGRSTRSNSAGQYRASNTKTRNNSFKTYRVRKGDTLSHISKKTGTSVAQIRRLNPKLRKSSMIRPGEVIRVGA